MRTRTLFLLVAFVVVSAACGDDTSGTPTGSDSLGIPGSSSTSTAAAVSTATTTTTTMATTTTRPGDFVLYEDPSGDCFEVATNELAPSCMPAFMDIVAVEMSRASPFTMEIVFAAPRVVQASDTYQMSVGLDLDRDPTTGITEYWPEFHAMGPDLEADFFGTGNENFIQTHAIEGQDQYMPLDPSPVEWTWLDDTHLQAVFDPDVVGDESFGVAGDFVFGDYFDTFVDSGHVVFPGGDIVEVGP